jgi:hypothetical protein
MACPSGGTADLSVTMPLASLRSDADFIPRVQVTAHNVVTDDLVRFAADHTVRAFTGKSGPRLAELITNFHPSGTFSGTALVEPDPSRAGSVNFSLSLTGLSASPALPGVTPTVTLSDTALAITTRAELFNISAHATAHAESSTTPIAVTVASAQWDHPQNTPAEPGAINLTVDAQAINLATNIAPVLEVFSPAAARRVTDVASSLKPAGKADIHSSVKLESSGDLDDLSLTFSSLVTPAVTLLGTRIQTTDSSGSFHVHIASSLPDTARLTFQNFSAQIAEDAGPTRVECNGTLDINSAHETRISGGDLHLQLSAARFESAPLRSIAASAMPKLGDLLTDYNPRGDFALDARWRPGSASPFTGTLEPHTLELTRDSHPIAHARVTGQVEFDPGQTTLHNLAITSDSFVAAFDGHVGFQSASPHFDIGVTLRSSGLKPDLLAALPPAIRSLVDDLHINAPDSSRLELADTRITSGNPPPKADDLSITGRLLYSDINFEAGVEVNHASGELLFASTRSADSAPTFTTDANFSYARAAGVSLSNGHVRIQNGSAPGDVLIPNITATCHGGSLAASASVLHPSTQSESAPRHFDLTLRASGVHFAPLVNELQNTPASSTTPATDLTRGVLDATLSLAGQTNLPESRRGRLFATVGGGEVAQFPGMVAFVKLANFQLPLAEPLDHARAAAHIDGSLIGFEELSLASEGISLIGYGTLEWPSTNLDLRFDSRSNRRIPVLSWALESLRDELVTAKVRGTLKDPIVTTEKLPGAASLLKDLSGRATEQDRRLERMRSDSQRTTK